MRNKKNDLGTSDTLSAGFGSRYIGTCNASISDGTILFGMPQSKDLARTSLAAASHDVPDNLPQSALEDLLELDLEE